MVRKCQMSDCNIALCIYIPYVNVDMCICLLSERVERAKRSL